jgi:hypothetical protein
MIGMPLPFFLFVTRLQLGLSRYDPPREPHATRENESRREIRGRGSIDRPTLSEDKSLGDGNLDRPNVSVDRSFGGGNLDGRGLSHIRERGMSSRLPMLPMHKYSPMSTPDGLDVAYAPSKPTSSSGEYFGGEGGGGHTGIVYPLVDLVGVDRVRSWADAIMLLQHKSNLWDCPRRLGGGDSHTAAETRSAVSVHQVLFYLHDILHSVSKYKKKNSPQWRLK